MEVLDCGHVAQTASGRMCRRIVEALAADKGTGFVRWLTGDGLIFDLLCSETCDGARQAGKTVELVEVCEGCFTRFQEDFGEGNPWRGEPGIPIREEPCDPTMNSTRVPDHIGTVTDLAPLPNPTGASLWMLLTDDGSLWRLNADTGDTSQVAQCAVTDESDQEPWAGHTLRRHLHVAGTGAFAAVVNDYGRYGQVIDLATGAVTISLDGGTYDSETVPFSLAFAEHDGRTVVVHRTEWNRLDISDAASGALLTDRRPTSYGGDGVRPEHYLDYFHGALRPSPGGHWLADDGWVWSPVGIPRVWDQAAWLSTNVWESDRDSPSEQYLCQRWYHWDSPMCWIDENLLAVSGIGDDDLAMLPGVRIFDVTTGIEVRTFAGPNGEFFARRGRLYSADPDALRIWNPLSGELTGTVPNFHPTRLHPTTGELVSVKDGLLSRWPARQAVPGGSKW